MTQPVISPHQKTAIILFNLGGPDSPEAVKPFLFHLFNDRAIIRLPALPRYLIARLISARRAPKARGIYAHMGGRSPILEHTQAQADALEKALASQGEVRVFVCMRYWHPMSDDVAAQVKAYAPDAVMLLPLYPQFSTTTTASSFTDWHRAAQRASLTVPTHAVCCYPTQKGWVKAQSNQVREAIATLPSGQPYRLIVSAHGLPESVIEGGDSYQWQVEQTTQSLLRQLADDGVVVTDAVNAYQSRVGPMKWIGPSTEAEIERAGAEDVAVVLVPVAFVSEHSETLVELDIEYAELAKEAGVPKYVRVPTVSTHPDFIAGLAEICRHVMCDEPLCSAEKRRVCPASFTGCPHPASPSSATSQQEAA